MKYLNILVVAAALFLEPCSSAPDPSKHIPESLLKFPPTSFAYPIGEADFVTEKNDWWDDWHNAQDFGENRHLGEDWNKKSGGDTDCGEPVFATSGGQIVFAGQTHAGRIKRTFAELVEYLFRSQAFPHGAILLTGAGVVPPDSFTLEPGDRVRIAIDGIGALENHVAVV